MKNPFISEKIEKLIKKVETKTGIVQSTSMDGFDSQESIKLLPIIRKALLEVLRERKVSLSLAELHNFLQGYGFLDSLDNQESDESPYEINWDYPAGALMVEKSPRLLSFLSQLAVSKHYRKALDISCYSEDITIYYPGETDRTVKDYFSENRWTNRHFSAGTPYKLFLRSYARSLLRGNFRQQTITAGNHSYVLAKLCDYCALSGDALTSSDDLDMYILRANCPSIKWHQGGAEKLSQIGGNSKYDMIFNFALPAELYSYIPRQHITDYSIQKVYPLAFERLKDDGMYVTLMHQSNLIDKECINYIVDSVGLYPAVIIPANNKDIYLVCWQKGVGKSYIIPFMDYKPEEDLNFKEIVNDILKNECKAHQARRSDYLEFYSAKHEELLERYCQYGAKQGQEAYNFNDLIVSIGLGKSLENNNSVFIPVTEAMFKEYGVMDSDEYTRLRASNILFDNYMFDAEKAGISYDSLFWFTENSVDDWYYEEESSGELDIPFDKFLEKSVIQIVFRDKKVHAGFIKYFLNSPHGGIYLDIIREQNLQGFFRIENFRNSRLLLPDIQTQRRLYEDCKILSVDITEKQLQQENLFACSGRERDKKNYYSTALKSWTETLPYPLASILSKVFNASSEIHRNKLLIDFFERWTQFHAVIVLSYYFQDVQRKHETEQKDKVKFPKKFIQNLSRGSKSFRLDMPSFSDWRTFLKLGECIDARDSITSFIKQMAAEDILDILRKISDERNKKAHGALPSERELFNQNQDMLEKVYQLRSHAGDLYNQFELLLSPFVGEAEAEDNFAFKALSATGGSPILQSVDVNSVSPLVRERLYFRHKDLHRCLELLPFVRIRPFVNINDNDLMQAYFYTKRDICSVGDLGKHDCITWDCYHSTHYHSISFVERGDKFVLLQDYQEKDAEGDKNSFKVAEVLKMLKSYEQH